MNKGTVTIESGGYKATFTVDNENKSSFGVEFDPPLDLINNKNARFIHYIVQLLLSNTKTLNAFFED